jgi:hypothetical protein
MMHMKLPVSPVRQQMENIMYEVDLARSRWEDVRPAYEKFNSVPGLKLVEMSDFDGFLRCEWFALREYPWYDELVKQRGQMDANLIVNNNFKKKLESNGILEVEKPMKGSILVYVKSPFEKECAEHFGTFQGNGLVHSKFHSGHVYEHAIGDVPYCFGNYVKVFHPIY